MYYVGVLLVDVEVGVQACATWHISYMYVWPRGKESYRTRVIDQSLEIRGKETKKTSALVAIKSKQ